MSDRPPVEAHARLRYVVVGAGSIGCFLGGVLAASGERVAFVGRAALVDRMRSHGLQLSDIDGGSTDVPPAAIRVFTDCAAAAVDAAAAEEDGDLCVLLCVKGGATRDAAREVLEAFGAGTTVVSCQNGVENVARIDEVAPTLSPVAAMVPFNVVRGDGVTVRRTTSGVLRVGRSPISDGLAQALTRAGLPTQIDDDMTTVLWGKLLLNLNNPINALSDLPLRDQLAARPYRVCLAALQKEALSVLRVARIEPAQIGALPPRWMPRVLRLPDPVFRLLAARMLRIDPAARSSMWDDLQAGRPTEIDDFCGAIVRLGRRHAVPTPCNARMLELISQHHGGESYDGHALRQRLRA